MGWGNCGRNAGAEVLPRRTLFVLVASGSEWGNEDEVASFRSRGGVGLGWRGQRFGAVEQGEV